MTVRQLVGGVRSRAVRAVRTYEASGQLTALPDEIWPLLIDTPSLNRALGLPRTAYVVTPGLTGRPRVEAMVKLGRWRMVRWLELPFHWRAPFGYVGFREFLNGPFIRMTIWIDLIRGESQTNAVIRLDFVPRNLLGTLLLLAGLGQYTTDRMVDLCLDIDRFLTGRESHPFPALVPRRPLPAQARRIADDLIAHGRPRAIVELLFQHISWGREEQVARMRPFELADRWHVERRGTLAVFLHATVAGLLQMTWDVLCPGCRVGKREVRTLRDVQSQAHCEICNVVFDASMDDLVELRFAPSPGVRSVSPNEFCIGGPINTPHIALQVPIQAGERQVYRCTLKPGVYRIRSTDVTEAELKVDESVETRQVAVSVTRDGLMPACAAVCPGEVELTITSVIEEPTVVTVEDTRWPDTIATAAFIGTMPEFRDLFSSEVLAPGLQLSVTRLAFMFTDLSGSPSLFDQVGPGEAYRAVQRHFKMLGETIAAENGAIVKTIDDGVMATFPSSRDALAAGLAILRTMRRQDLGVAAHPERMVRIGIHEGPCLAVTANDRLDYFGAAVNIAARMMHEARGGDVLITARLCESPDGQAVLSATKVHREPVSIRPRGADEELRAYRLRPLDLE